MLFIFKRNFRLSSKITGHKCTGYLQSHFYLSLSFSPHLSLQRLVNIRRCRLLWSVFNPSLSWSSRRSLRSPLALLPQPAVTHFLYRCNRLYLYSLFLSLRKDISNSQRNQNSYSVLFEDYWFTNILKIFCIVTPLFRPLSGRSQLVVGQIMT